MFSNFFLLYAQYQANYLLPHMTLYQGYYHRFDLIKVYVAHAICLIPHLDLLEQEFNFILRV